MILLFIAAIAFLHAIREGLEEKFTLTRFRFREPKFWNPAVSRKQAKLIPVIGFRYDAITVSSLIMMVLIVMAFAFSKYSIVRLPFGIFINAIIYLVVYVAAYNLSLKYYLFKIKPDTYQ